MKLNVDLVTVVKYKGVFNMMYVRPARRGDFEDFKIEYDYDYGQFVQKEVIELIAVGKMKDAITLFNEKTGIGAYRAKAYCEEYQRYFQAKKDFERGKEVFVSY